MLKNEMMKQQFLKAKLLMKNLMASVSYVTLFVIFIALMIFIGITIYISKKIRYESIKCQEFTVNEDKLPTFKEWPTSWTDPVTAPFLNDLQVISAYNCCSIGSNKASFVKMCALRNCLKMGARFLDFEIYDIDDTPYVATSSSLSFNYKESYNKLKLSEVLTFINTNAFNIDFVGNLEEYPIILHFRIKSNNTELFKNITSAIKESIDSAKLMDQKYSKNFTNGITQPDNKYLYNGADFKPTGDLNSVNYPKPIGHVRVSEMKEKVVIIMKNFVDGENCGGLTKENCYLPDDNQNIIGWGQYLEKGLGLDICANYVDAESIPQTPAPTSYYNNLSNISNADLAFYINNLSTTQSIDKMNNEYTKIFTEGQADMFINDKKTNYGYYKIDKFNKFFMSIVIPELHSNINYDGTKYLKEQIQIVCMKFQYLDEELKKYINFFKEGNIVCCFKEKTTHPPGEQYIDLSNNRVQMQELTTSVNGASCLSLDDVQGQQDVIRELSDGFDKKNKIAQLEQVVNQHNNDRNCNTRFIKITPNQWDDESKI